METLNPAHSLLVTLRDFGISLRGLIQYECKYKLIYFVFFFLCFASTIFEFTFPVLSP